jgi:hypothetical protein
MIDRHPIQTAVTTDTLAERDERSMRIVEYALALLAFGAAVLLAVR